MTGWQQRIVSVAKRRLDALTLDDQIELRHRDAGRDGQSVELILHCEEDGHAFMTRTTIGWWAQHINVERAVDNLVRELQQLYVCTVAEMGMFAHVIANSRPRRDSNCEGK